MKKVPYVFQSRAELLDHLQLRTTKANAEEYFSKRLPDIASVVRQSIAGNTFRAFQKLPERPSVVFRNWASHLLHQTFAEITNITGRESYSARNKTTIAQILQHPKDRMAYEYDFGDGWEHDVILEAILAPAPDGLQPIVEAGKRACPPEDVGGIPGYDDFLAALRDPRHPEHGDMLEWVGGSFNPESFSVGEANLAIHGGWVRREPDA